MQRFCGRRGCGLYKDLKGNLSYLKNKGDNMRRARARERGRKRSNIQGFEGYVKDFGLYPKVSDDKLKDFNKGETWSDLAFRKIQYSLNMENGLKGGEGSEKKQRDQFKNCCQNPCKR